jgi:hypothetical protein
MSEPRDGPRSRAGTVPIAAHLPKEVRDRPKILAVRLDRTMNELMAEALSDLFTKHGEPPVPEKHRRQTVNSWQRQQSAHSQQLINRRPLTNSR